MIQPCAGASFATLVIPPDDDVPKNFPAESSKTDGCLIARIGISPLELRPHLSKDVQVATSSPDTPLKESLPTSSVIVNKDGDIDEPSI